MTANISRGLKEFGNHEIAAVVAVDPVMAAPYFANTATLKHIRLPYNYMRSRALKRAFDRVPLFQPIVKPIGLLTDNALQPINRLHGVQLASYMKKIKPDVIHLNNGSRAIASMAKLNIPIVYHLHGAFPKQLSRRDFLLLSKVTRFIAVSEFVKDTYVSTGLDPTRVSVVHNFVMPRTDPTLTVSEARQLMGMPSDGHIVGFVGRIVPWKGPREFIAAMAIVAKRFPDTRFLLIGDSTETPEYVAELHSQITKENLKARITFVEHMADTYVAYRACSVFVHASIEPEPFGMVIVEAMQAGTPVVAANQGGPTEIIENGISGFLVDPTNSEGLASAVIRLLEDEALRTSIITAAEKRVAQHFSVSEAIKGILHTYRQALSSSAHGGCA